MQSDYAKNVALKFDVTNKFDGLFKLLEIADEKCSLILGKLFDTESLYSSLIR
jgi:hypothetical protein